MRHAHHITIGQVFTVAILAILSLLLIGCEQSGCAFGEILDDDMCRQTVYTCNNGIPASGAPFGSSIDIELCSACNDGYYLHGIMCDLNTYTCAHGASAPAGTPGATNGQEFCIMCMNGYILNTNDNSCRLPLYTCAHGQSLGGHPPNEPATETSDVEYCVSCDIDHLLLDTICNQITRILTSDRRLGDLFGVSVATNGDRAIVGAHKHDVSAMDNSKITDAGAAYIFAQSDSGWVEQAKITANDAQPNDEFGYAVAMAGDRAIIGAHRVGGDDAGAVYIFAHNGSEWTEETKITASDGMSLYLFGFSVAISVDGNRAIVGSHAPHDSNATGSAYLFTRDNDGEWTNEHTLVPSNGMGEEHYGRSTAMNDARIIIGANGDGSAYIYDLP